MQEELINSIVIAMSEDLTGDQLQRLERVLAIKLHGLKVERECTALVTSERHYEKILKRYRATKRLENCSEGTLAGYTRCLTQFFERTNKKIRDITTDDIRFYLAIFREEAEAEGRHLSLSYMDTIRRYLSAFFSWATDEGYVNRNPCRRLKKIKIPKKIKPVLTTEERACLRHISENPMDMALMEFLYSTACRVGEVIPLNRDDVDFAKKEIVIYGQKGKAERKVYLTSEAVFYLKNYLSQRKDNNPALFVSNKKPYDRLGIQAIQNMLKNLGRRIGLHVHPHIFRRTMLTDLSTRGMPLQEIQHYAGHVKPETTMEYVQVKDKSVKSSFNRLIA